MGKTICAGNKAAGNIAAGNIAAGIIAAGIITAGILAGGLVLNGCEGSESREEVDATVETVVGKEQTDQFKAVKKELQAIETQQADRYKALDEE
jgi:hypothetical protein